MRWGHGKGHSSWAESGGLESKVEARQGMASGIRISQDHPSPIWQAVLLSIWRLETRRVGHGPQKQRAPTCCSPPCFPKGVRQQRTWEMPAWGGGRGRPNGPVGQRAQGSRPQASLTYWVYFLFPSLLPHGNGNTVPALQNHCTDKYNRCVKCFPAVSTQQASGVLTVGVVLFSMTVSFPSS